MALSNFQLDAFLQTIRDDTTFVSLHTGDPGTTGANEVSGGTYARVAVTFGAQSTISGGRRISVASQVSVNVPAGTTVTFVGVFDAVTGGNFIAGLDSNDETFAAAGIANITTNNNIDVTNA